MLDGTGESLATSLTQTYTTQCGAQHDVLDRICGETLWSRREDVKVGPGRSFQRVVWQHSNPGWKHEAVPGRRFANH